MRKQTLSESIDFIMIASLTIAFSALLGVVGYKVTHKTQTNIPIANPPIKNEVVVSTDKTEYEKGEVVKAILNFSKDIYINPYVKIYKFENNNWQHLGYWTFDGTQYTCCGVLPDCEKNNASKSPLEIKWDQKVVKEELPIFPGNPMTKTQADSGKYKIEVVYGDQSVCADGIDVEFTIKEPLLPRDMPME